MRLFLYGTLRHAALFDAVAGPGASVAREAWAEGFTVERVVGSVLPMIRAEAGARAVGVLREGVSAAQRARLDRYELAFGYVLREVTVETGEEPLTALVYMPPEGQVSSGEAWSLAAWEREAAEATLLAVEELDAHDPPLEGADLARQWPMIAARAEARLRARRTEPVAVRRFRPDPDDWEWRAAAPLAGGFFKLAAMEMEHRRFDGGRAAGLRREVLVGVDAALVLPYDPVRDRVLLVEQFRAAPARRGDRNPWTLEPVAGIVDAGESPEAAARREAEEEAGVILGEVRRMFAFYPSPGSSTDHFHCYLGLCNLPDGHAAHGGLAEEAEDLRLHVMTREEALALADSGEVTAGPLLAMLFWLDRNMARGEGGSSA
jgi:ADP-ribose pyrophosphatase